jgi:parallel beta-helix repeat protein
MKLAKTNLFLYLIFLLPINSYTQVHVSGNISGYWSNMNVYIIDSDVIIQEFETLTIQEGTLIKISSNSNITVNGLLSAIGTESSPITFTSFNNPIPGDWGQLRFTNSSDNNSILSFCIIEYGGIESVDPGIINIDGSNPTIENCELRYIDGNGIYFVDNSSSLIKKNKVHDFTGIGIWADAGNNSPIIENNTVFNGFKGIKASTLQTSFLINSNIVYEMYGVCIDVSI